jgi:hypothetical protein
MNYIEEEGEHSGLQVIIVPYTGGYKLIWRSGEGRLIEPLLLDATKRGQTFHVRVPNSEDDSGDWVLSLDRNLIHAVGPRGLHFDLHETAFRDHDESHR